MEIKIDTAKDSIEDIKKVIGFLQHFIESSESADVNVESEGMFNMFGDDSSTPDSSESEKEDSDFKIMSYDEF